ncbi:hypothetical protein BRAS3843_1160005 [Bradyrhizobium sp. STM 3843]|nr:hypothetical protein BRAS3843_1160005 [Bradyrhizobium sp. STM 3843]
MGTVFISHPYQSPSQRRSRLCRSCGRNTSLASVQASKVIDASAQNRAGSRAIVSRRYIFLNDRRLEGKNWRWGQVQPGLKLIIKLVSSITTGIAALNAS